MALEPLLHAHQPPPQNPGPPWAAPVAALLPLAALLVAPALFIALVGPGELVHRIEDGGPPALLVLCAFALGAVVASVCGALLARGARVPAAVPIAFAALPWLVGNAGMRLAMRATTRAFDAVSPADKATILAAGLSEASVDRQLGALLSSVLLALVGLSLAVAARARSQASSPAGALIGVASAFPMLAAALLVPSFGAMGATALLPLLPALAAAAGMLIASRAASPDAPHARSSALAAAAGVPFGIAFVGAGVAAAVAQVSRAAGALAAMNPADRATIALAAVDELQPLGLLASWGWALAAVPVLAVGGWALMRGSTVRAPVGELASAVLVLLVVAGADLSAARAVTETAARAAQRPWAHVPGFQPLKLAGNAPGASVDGVVSPGDPPGEWTGRVVSLAIDSRVGADQLRQLVDGLVSRGVSSLVIAGDPVLPRRAPERSAYDPASWLFTLTDVSTGVELRLLPGGPPRLQRVELTTLAELVAKAGGLQPGITAALPSAFVEEEPAHEADEPAQLPLIAGPMDKEAIRAVIQRSQGQFRGCYERVLQVNPAIRGKVTVKLVIGPDGHVQSADTGGSTTNSAPLERCVAGKLRALVFPAPGGGGTVTVIYPFVFEPAE